MKRIIRCYGRSTSPLYLFPTVIEDEEFQYKAIQNNMYRNVLNDLADFSIYVKAQLNRILMVIIDGINENQYL